MNAVYLQLQFIFMNVVKMQSDKQRQRTPLNLQRWTFGLTGIFFVIVLTDESELVFVWLCGKIKTATVEKEAGSNSIRNYYGQRTVEDEVLRMVFGDGHLGV